jgi:hypothetical protein
MQSYPNLLRALLALLFCAPAFAQPAPPQHGVLEDEPHTGSMIRQELTHGSGIPINKTWNELTPEEKASVNQFYESMGPGDEPPFPALGLKPIHRAMAKLQQALLVSGELYLMATVDRNGNVVQIKAIGNPDDEMTKAAATVLSITKFKPALCKGVPCQMDYPFRFSFNVKH